VIALTWGNGGTGLVTDYKEHTSAAIGSLLVELQEWIGSGLSSRRYF
jgi:hypothetical protein